MKIQTFIFNWRGQYENTRTKEKQLQAIGVSPIVINSDDDYIDDYYSVYLTNPLCYSPEN
jgi:hypothetical protein